MLLADIEAAATRYQSFREIEAEHLPLCRDQGLGVIAYNPLAGGFLSGKYQSKESPPAGTRFTLGKTGDLYRERYWQQSQFEAVEHLRKFFQARGKSLVQVAIAWVLAQPGITSAIVGASRPEQLDATIAAADYKLDPALKQRLDELTAEYRKGDAPR